MKRDEFLELDDRLKRRRSELDNLIALRKANPSEASKTEG